MMPEDTVHAGMDLRRPGPAAGRVLGLSGVWLVGLALTGATVLGQGHGLTPQKRQQTLAQAALIVADRMYRGGQIERAMDHWREALSYDPNLVQAHYLLGLSLRDQGRPEEALTHLRTTTELDPDNATAFADLGDTLHEQGDTNGALQAYGAALRLAPESAALHSNYGYLLVQKGDIDGAVAAWRTAVRLEPDYPPPYANLGEALADQGQRQDAIAAYQTFLELAPYAPHAEEVGQRLEALLRDADPTPDAGAHDAATPDSVASDVEAPRPRRPHRAPRHEPRAHAWRFFGTLGSAGSR